MNEWVNKNLGKQAVLVFVFFFFISLVTEMLWLLTHMFGMRGSLASQIL